MNKISKEDKKFMEGVFRNWGYYGAKAHKIAEDIKIKLQGGLK